MKSFLNQDCLHLILALRFFCVYPKKRIGTEVVALTSHIMFPSGYLHIFPHPHVSCITKPARIVYRASVPSST